MLSAPAIVLLAGFFFPCFSVAQTQGHTLYGDLRIDEKNIPSGQPLTFRVTLYAASGNVYGRDQVNANGRYQFLNVRNGEYDLVVESDNVEVGRVHFIIDERRYTDLRRDVTLEFRPGPSQQGPTTGALATTYARGGANSALFQEALQAGKMKDYGKAIRLLTQVTAADPKDYEAWTELGTIQFQKGDTRDAEESYLHSLAENPAYVVALVNLGKLRYSQKNFDGAIEVLSKAVEVEPRSADAQYFLGDSYLQVKKGSKAVGCLNEAIRLDPVGKAEAHLRLAALYNAARMKDRAAAEYEQFLAKNPDYPDRKALEQYIRENKK